jgi:pentapeptide repeat protein
MANQDHLLVLKKGVAAWNAWRASNPGIKPDLAAASLAGRKLQEIDLRGADLKGGILNGCDLSGANLSNAQLGEATLRDGILAGAILYGATLRRSDCRGAFLRWADLSRADFTGAKLSKADLRRTHLARTVFKDADLSGCGVYGSAVWNVELDGAVQTDLVITEQDEPEITVDDLEVAQFVYLILNNRKIRNIIDSMTSKAVLLLPGRAGRRETRT